MINSTIFDIFINTCMISVSVLVVLLVLCCIAMFVDNIKKN